jgi:hypothetical protein
MLRALGRHDEAAGEDRAASRLTSNPAELSLLERRLSFSSGAARQVDEGA